MLARLRAQLQKLLTERGALHDQQAQIINTCRAADNRDLTGDEEAQYTSLAAEKRKKDEEIEPLQARIAELEDEEARDTRAAELRAQVTSAGDLQSRATATTQVNERRTYNVEGDRSGQMFLADVQRQFLFNDLDSATRLAQHMREERHERGERLQADQQRAVGTGAYAGLVVPQYLTDMYAPAARAMRPFADICNRHDLPATGMTVSIGRVTTVTTVDVQSAENAAVSETDIDDTLHTIPVQTAGGSQTISRQAIERGAGTDEVTLDDLFRAYATNLDSKLLNQATTGLSAVSTAVTYTDASPTGAELYPKILNAQSNSEEAVLAQAEVDYTVMHSRRWYWLQSQMSATWPLIGQQGIPPQNAGLSNGVGYDKGPRGVLPNGTLVITDNNISKVLGAGTNEDEVFTVPSRECHLWEDPNAPMYIRAEQPKAKQLAVDLVVYGYFAYFFGRYPGAMQKVSGTGLVTPLFA